MTTNNPGSIRMPLFSTFIISVSLFLYQVLMTRLYSAVFSYHFVFLITSFAVLGLGLGSILAYTLRKKKNKAGLAAKKANKMADQNDVKGQISKGSIILAVSYITVFALNYLIPYVNNLLIYVVLGTIPFLIGGYLYSLVFTEFSSISGKLYFGDLVGSGLGSLTVIFLLNDAGMFKTIMLVCVIALMPALIYPIKILKFRIVGYILTAVFVAGFLLPGQYVSTVERDFNGLLNNSEKTFGSIKQLGLSPKIVFSKWNAFSRTDVIKIPQQPDKMLITIDGAANAPMYKFDGNIKSLEAIKSDTGFLPYTIGNNKKTLLIGSGGGRDVLYALAGGSEDITAVDINTSSIDAVKAFGDYNGNIYNRPEVKVYGEDGRGFVRRSADKYDLIFLSLVMTNTSQGMAYALSENYIYTVEAINDYLDHLNNDGKVVFLAHDEDDLQKVLFTSLQALRYTGIPLKDTPKHIAVFTKYMSQGHEGTKVHEPVVIIKKQPFSQVEGQNMLKTAKENGIAPLYIPDISAKGILYQIKEAQISVADYQKNLVSQIPPATDNSPYFYNFGRGIPGTLVLILLVVLILGLLILSPFVIKQKNKKQILYFSLLGTGFMMIEVPLIQKFTLYLGHPALAFTFVLAALLIGGGLGGYYSNNRLFNSFRYFYLPPVLVAIINVIFLLSLDSLFQTTSTLQLAGRIAIASGLVMLLGFFMGMPFPRGLKLIADKGKGDTIPIMWGANGITSVIGSVLAIILAILIGFKGALAAGAGVYLFVSFFRNL